MGEAGALRAVVFGYACHATTLDISQWCGDYPGFAQANLEAAHPGSAALFVAGCGADANPLPRRSLEACVKHGRSLADAVENVLAAEMTPIRGRLAAAFNLLDLPFDHLPEREALERHRDHGHPIERGWAARLIAELDAGRELPPSYPCALQAFRLGDRLTLVALAGEVVVEYAHRIKSATGRDDTWVVAYANDVFGYVPSRRVLAEGGYEADLATAVYGLPARWSPVIEERIVTAATDMIASVRCVGDQEGETGEG
jgi:hypothetical protein